MENKQTAVEWYEQEINLLIEKYQSNEISERELITMKHNLFYQAQQIEKEQMCKFAYKCHNHYKVNGAFKIEEYYEEKYGNNNGE